MKSSLFEKLEYARDCLQANPREEPRLQLFVKWLYGEALADDVTEQLPVLTKPSKDSAQLNLFSRTTK